MTELLRRDLIVGSATALAVAAAPLGAYGNATELGTPGFLTHAKGEYPIGTITTNDGSTIFLQVLGKANPLRSATVGHCRRTTGMSRCWSSGKRGIASLHMTAGDTGAPLRPGMALTWVHTLTMSRS